MNEAQRLKERRLLREARPYFRQLAQEAEAVRLRAIGKGQGGRGKGEDEAPEEEGSRQPAEGSDEKSGRDARGPSEEEARNPSLEDSTDRPFRGGEYR